MARALERTLVENYLGARHMGTRNNLRAFVANASTCTPGTWQALIMGIVGLCLFVSGCALSYETTKSPRAPSEQLLLAQSLRRSLVETVLPLGSGQTIAVETVGLTTDQAFVSRLIEKWLSRGGLLLPKDGKELLIANVTLEPSPLSKIKPSSAFLQLEEDLSRSHCPSLPCIRPCGSASMPACPLILSKRPRDDSSARRRFMKAMRTTINIRSYSLSMRPLTDLLPPLP